MVNYIWGAMILLSIIFGFFNGTMPEINKSIFEGAQEAVKISIGLISILVFWLGIMEVAQKSGLLDKLSRLVEPIVRIIFPDVPKGHPAMGYMVSNMIANMLGLGNAATPLGLKAMGELKKLNQDKDEASRSMVTFLAINTSSITLIPTTVIALRTTYGSRNPTEIIISTALASTVSTVGAILVDRYYYYKRREKGDLR